MKKALKALHPSRLRDQSGVTIILVVILMLIFLGIAALAIDLSNLYVVRNELQNAADAGALAGARFLYNDYGTEVNAGANQIAYDAATANKALAMIGAIAVDVNWAPGQNEDAEVDVQRGHWSFAMRTFTANDSLAAVDLWDRSTESLDFDTNFINAVRVVARRQATPAASFFARIFGHANFILSAEAVAYIGFAGSLSPEDVDQPIAICQQAILDSDGHYTCNTGRMINSSGGTTTNTAAWTNFSQEPCETASASSVRPLVCGGGPPGMLNFGDGMGTVGGMQDNVYQDLRDCWLKAEGLMQDSRGYPTKPWRLTLSVIDCPENNPGSCSDMIGAVTLEVLWIKQSGADPQWMDIPLQMEDWNCSNAGDTAEQRQACWQEFSTEFHLLTANGTDVGVLTPSELQKTIFFKPNCEPHEPKGTTGGENYGVLARIPVLVM